ncbi:MAG: hypothetical protein AB7P49_00080 [Bdellovibrionales bacterium]
MKRRLQGGINNPSKILISSDDVDRYKKTVDGISLVPVLCSTSSTQARISDPMHLETLYLNETERTAHGFGMDDAVVLPLITSFKCPGTSPEKSPAHNSEPSVVLFSEDALQRGCVFVNSASLDQQLAHETAWLSQGYPSKSLVSRPVLLPISSRRFVRSAESRDAEKWAAVTSKFYRPGEDASKIADLSVSNQEDDCATCFAVRWARLVNLFVPSKTDELVFARMCYMLGIPSDSPAIYTLWPIAKSTAEESIVNGTDVTKAARLLATGSVRWKMQYAYLPIWLVPVFLSAVNAVMNEEIHSVQRALMQITGQLSVLSAYDNPSRAHAARALDRVFSVVEVIKSDTAMHLIDAAFSVGPVLQNILQTSDRTDQLETSMEESRTRVAQLETQVIQLTSLVESLVGMVVQPSMLNNLPGQ